MATTSPDNIWTQDSADNYDLVVDAAATAASIQAALVTRANSYKGTTAQRTAFTATAPEGTLWSDTNGNKVLWIKQGASWVQVWPTILDDNKIWVGGVAYTGSGVFSTLPSYTLTNANPVYYGAIPVDRPYTPPSGYGFAVHVVRTSRYTSVSVSDITAATLNIRYVQFATGTIDSGLRLGWTLVKA